MRFLRFLFLFLLGACAASEPTEDERLISDAQAIRELTFLEPPKILRRVRAEYLAELAAEEIDPFALEYTDATAGRLGFYPPNLERSGDIAAQLVGAFYSLEERTITLFEDSTNDVLVHELVHALQDQHFDLSAFREAATSSDESLARGAVLEGDARVCQTWFAWRQFDDDPVGSLRGTMTASVARKESEMIFGPPIVPRYFLAYQAFVYPYGTVLMAHASGIDDMRWSSVGRDALFRAPPKSTDEVLRAVHGLLPDPPTEVGLVELPQDLIGRYRILGVDRLGAWLASLLGGELLDWDGDQLVMLASTEGRPSAPDRIVPSAVAWTSSWDTEYSAMKLAVNLGRLHPGKGTMAADGDEAVVLWKDKRVAFVKGRMSRADAIALAGHALTSAAKRVLPIQGSAFPVPRLASDHR